MRKLMAIAMVIAACSARSWALVGLTDVKYDGSLEFNGISANNEVDKNSSSGVSDHRGGTNSRLRLGLNANVTEGVSTRLEFGRNGQFGRSLAGTQNGSNSIDNETANIRIQNAYLDFNDLFGFKVRLGRQYVGNPGDLVWNISPTDDDSLTFNAVDGVLVQCRHFDFIHADFFTGKLFEDDAVNGVDNGVGATGDTNLSSLDFVLPTLVPGGKINLGYVWGVNQSSEATSNNNTLKTYRIGINGGVMNNMLTYRAEYFMNDGENKPVGLEKISYDGSALDLGVGYNSPETPAGTFGAHLNYLSASGDDKVGDNKDKSFHDFTRLGFNSSDRLLGEIFGKSNVLTAIGANPISAKGTPLGQGLDTGIEGKGLQVINIGIGYTPKQLPKGNLRIDYFTFKAAEDGDNSALPKADKYGNEIDLSFGYNHSEAVTSEIGYATFSPDNALIGTTSGTKDDKITKLFAKLKVKWGGEEK